MKKFLKLIVPIFFFVGVFFFIKRESKVNIPKSINQDDQKMDSLSTNKPVSHIDLFTTEKPDPAIINERIKAESVDDSSKDELLITDSLIKKYLIDLDNYNSYVMIISSKTFLTKNSYQDEKQYKPITEKEVKDYRQSILKDLE